MTTSSFLFVVRVPVEDGNDANDKETKDKKDDRPGDKDIPLKQDAVQKESVSTNQGTTKSTDTQTIGKKDQVQSASLSQSSDVDDDSTTPVKPENVGAILDNHPITTSQTPLSESSSVKAIDISSTPSDPQTSPLPLNTPQESSDPSQNVMFDTIDPSIDRDMETPPPWDFTPPSTPSSTSTSAQQDTDVVESTDPQNQEPEKTKPPPAWTFPTFGKSKKESDVLSVKNTESQESDSVAKPTDVAQLPEISVDHQPPSSPDPNPSSNETSSSDPLPADKRADKTVDEKQDQDDAKPVDIEEKTQQSSDDSTDKFPPESKDKPVEPASEKDKDKDKDFEIFVKTESLFQRTMSVLESYAVKNLCVHKTANGKYFQFMFVEEGENCEEILNKLAEIGIGDNTQSSISLFETSIYKGTGGVLDMEEEEEELYDSAPSSNSYEQKKSEFKKSIKARMLVTEVVNSVQGNAEFTFDFLLLVILASSISAMGLVENSSVVLVASMLVSPIMGPILAGTFGTVIQNNTLRNLGIKNELRSLLICVAMGMVWGLVCGGVCKDGAFWGSTDSWPTSEMKSRGMTRSLWTGVLIALPSGAGVALSILGGNTGSLVGVAISASLLPPAVNAGMLWASAIIASIAPPPRVQTITSPVTTTPNVLNYTVENTTQTTSTVVSELTTSPTLTPTLNCLPLVSNAYVPVYSCDMAEEMLYLGLFSLLLTILNIICIIIMGIIVLKIKEVAPQVALSEETKTFWSEDIKIAKASYVTMKGNQSKNLSQQARELLNEWRKDNGDEPIQLLQLERLTQEIDDDPRVKDIQMRIPGGMRGDLVSRHFADEINKDEEKFEVIHHQYKTFHALQNLHGHSRRNLFHTNFYNGYYPSPSTSTGSMRRKKEVSTSLTEVNEKNVPFSADGPIKPAKSPGHFSKAFGILRNPRAGRSNLFRRRANNSKPEEKQIRFAVEKVPDTEVKVQIMKDADNQSVSQPLLEKQESV